ncbi:ABC transporter ATP-binding protein [Micromonosporaceae bacterium Da 78-11]
MTTSDFDPTAPLLAVADLRVEFHTRDGVAQAVNGVSFTLQAGETLALLGESGCGKSVTAQAMMGVLDCPPGRITAGEVRYRGTDLLRVGAEQRRAIQGDRVSMVFQDALSALNPVLSVGFQIAEMFRIHRDISRADGRRRAVQLLDMVQIPDARQRARDYPHQFSGGMRQRVLIAMALALDPEVMIADEPTTALDVTVQAQIIELLKELRAERDMGLIMITHDMGVVADIADRIAVMYAGRIVEYAPVRDAYVSPAHPYTSALLRSIPRMDRKGHQLSVVPGGPPVLTSIPSGCAFHPRCAVAQDICRTETPPLTPFGVDRGVACHFPEKQDLEP